MRMIKRARGFTLVELLVVIAIIAILAAILFPVLMAARDKGNQANCAGNAKQLAVALHTYVADFGCWGGASSAFARSGDPWWPFVERNPRAQAGQAGYVAGPANRLWIARYCRSARVLQCPSNRGATAVRAWIHAVKVPNDTMPQMNFTFAWDYTMNGAVPSNIDQVRRPRRLPSWVEENANSKYKNPYKDDGTGNVINDVLFTGSDITSHTHSGRANVAFCDGHVAALPGGLCPESARWPDGTPLFYEPQSR